MTKILLTFVGNNDCHGPEKPGAILSILEEKQFDIVYLLYNNEKYLKPASDILQYCKNKYPNTEIHYFETPIENPTDYNTVYPAMYQAVKNILSENQKAKYTISITSGTPTMHACWIFLKQGGVIDAELIQVQRETGISEVDFQLDDFPKIQNIDAVKAELTKLSRENRNLKAQKRNFPEIIGESTAMLKVKEQISLFAETDISIFINGESGTGKELVAEAIHFSSPRKEKPFIKVNCGAISNDLFESEFFGHKKGSFTGAVSDKDGKFSLAHKGTIFLDEVGDLPLHMQTKLLRVLQEGKFTPIGTVEEVNVDVRVISATNKNIRILVQEKKFREDLFYRLVKSEIFLPPLMDRGNDVLLIAEYLLSIFNKKYSQKKYFSQSAISQINDYSWPGNIRQLQNSIETAVILAENMDEIKNIPTIDSGVSSKKIIIPETGIDFDRELVPQYYKAAIEKAEGNKAKAAELLGIEPHTFRARLRKLGIK
ncbi:MAG: RNA repair transcriptional activator RtcR family protein [bacterium]